MSQVIIAPSILSSNFSKLGEEIKAVEKAGADWIHVDVMDGMFVDNITIGPGVIKSVREVSSLPFDVHLMIEKPERYVDAFLDAGADYLTLHVEASSGDAIEAALRKIRARGAKPGITLRPQTSLERVEKFFPLVDLVLIMTVSPGWGGQAFMQDQLEKVRAVRTWANANKPMMHVEVDGGINAETAKLARTAGANVFVAGNYIYRSKDYASAIASLR
ncbi:MAG: ribulose-phosphate 3-epimerase [Oligoflexia bacterium]|nr:ribulose-phosphate 3-epimerase [Oligoflexia bacterium]